MIKKMAIDCHFCGSLIPGIQAQVRGNVGGGRNRSHKLGAATQFWWITENDTEDKKILRLPSWNYSQRG